MSKQKMVPFFTLNGRAEEAMNFYCSVFPDTKITKLVRYGKEHPFATDDEADKILHGELLCMGQKIMFMDMDKAHPAPDFCWAASLYIDCEDEAQFDSIFSALSRDGIVMMGPEPVGSLRKCAWVTDPFGITWQPVFE